MRNKDIALFGAERKAESPRERSLPAALSAHSLIGKFLVWDIGDPRDPDFLWDCGTIEFVFADGTMLVEVRREPDEPPEARLISPHNPYVTRLSVFDDYETFVRFRDYDPEKRHEKVAHLRAVPDGRAGL